MPSEVTYIPPKTDVIGRMAPSTFGTCGLPRRQIPANNAPASRLSSSSSDIVAIVSAYATMHSVNSSPSVFLLDLIANSTILFPMYNDVCMNTTMATT